MRPRTMQPGHAAPGLRTAGIAVTALLVIFSSNARGDEESPEYAMGWWNTLNAAQMVAALHGDMATPEQTTAAQKMYADLDEATRALVDAAAKEIYGEGGHDSVGAWWETLDCRKMRIAAGDGNTADPMSPYCAHYPGSGAARILGAMQIAHVNMVGQGLLGRSDPGMYPSLAMKTARWWNSLNAEQMVAALHGDMATPEQTTAAQKMYADLDEATKALVDAAVEEIYGEGGHSSVGAWWETLDCRKMRIAAGDGNTADPMSPYCAHYPGSGAAKILGAKQIVHVNRVGTGLIGRDDPGVYPDPDVRAARWWNSLNAEQMVAALYGDMATPEQAAAARMMYADLDHATKGRVDVATAAIYGAGGHDSVGAWWETLDCRKMRIAAGDGNTASSASPFCAHYPGSGAAKILGADARAHVDLVGKALLGREDNGMYPPSIKYAMNWWNSLNAEQMVAALYGDSATAAQAAAARKMYDDLDGMVRGDVNVAAAEIYGNGGFKSVGAWWESLDCRKMRIAAGDGNTADPSSAFCTHFPGSGSSKIISAAARRHVNVVGQALLGLTVPGTYPPRAGTPPLLYTNAKCRDGLCRATAGATVMFRDTTGDRVSERSWNIEGGMMSSAVSVEHSWATPGFYKVSLTVTNGGEESTATRHFLVEASAPTGLCVSTPNTRCLHDSRYAVSARWWAKDGQAGMASVAHGGTNQAGLFSFHNPDNWEILIKVLDGCAINRSVWTFGASPSDLGQEIHVTDTMTGMSKVYRNEAGHRANAIIDTGSFPGACGVGEAASQLTDAGSAPEVPAAAILPAIAGTTTLAAQETGECTAGMNTLCLRDGRYEVTVNWTDMSGDAELSKKAGVAMTRSSESGLFYFFEPGNWELMLKVLDGCSVNGHHWVFGAAATDVGFDITVRDLTNGTMKQYMKKPGRPVPAITDVTAFPMAGCSPQ